MSKDIELSCRCGAIHGWVRAVAPDKINRAICYCDDCQAFLHHLGRADLLDDHGGTDVVQVAPNTVAFDRGAERIAGVRLGPKGLYRWYASCCKTPLGNTSTPAIPFVGLPMEVFRGAPDAARRDEAFGKARGAVQGRFATGGAPPGSTKLPLGMLMHAVRLLLGWKLTGKAWPHPFFDSATRTPSHPCATLPPKEREALRAYCGPHPRAATPPAS
jgi:hypothetical protein